MPSSPVKLKRVSPGQPITAEWFNGLIDAVNALSGAGHGYGRSIDVHDQRMSLPESQEPAIKPVELNANVGAYEADGKSGDILTIDDDNEGTASFVTAGPDTLADIAEIQGASHLSGERHFVLEDESTGLAYIMPSFTWQIAKLTSTLSEGGTGTADIWYVTGGSEAVSTLTGETVYGWGLSATLESGTEVFVVYHRQSRRWYVVSRCSETASAS